MEEIWKDIKGYEGLYQVSNLGRIKSLEREIVIKKQQIIYTRIFKGRILKQFLTKNGYLKVSLSNNKVKCFQVHRLVAQTFIPNLKKLPEVNHIDGDKTNNNVKNLEWVTSQENIIHAYKNGLNKISKKKRENCRKLGKASRKAVDQYDVHGNFIKTWRSILDASKHFKTNDSHIGECCNGKRKTAGGYIWKYHNIE